MLTQYGRNPLQQHERALGRKLYLFLCFLKAELIGLEEMIARYPFQFGEKGDGYFGNSSRIATPEWNRQNLNYEKAGLKHGKSS